VLAELGVVEQRYRAVLEVLEEGLPVTEVARRHGVARQTVHEWLARYAAAGWRGWRTGRRGWRRARIR
jgi:transposase-like protein